MAEIRLTTSLFSRKLNIAYTRKADAQELSEPDIVYRRKLTTRLNILSMLKSLVILTSSIYKIQPFIQEFNNILSGPKSSEKL